MRKDKTSDKQTALLTVEQLEQKLKRAPANVDIKEELSQAVLDRYIYEQGDEKDLDRLKDLLTSLPKDRALYARGYMAWLNHDDRGAVNNFCDCAVQVSADSTQPLTCDKLWLWWMVPFGEDTPQGLWERLAKAFSRNWPDSAVVFALFGMAEDDTGHTDGAVDYFVQALHKDPAYWLAAWCCAGCYAAQKNWRAARGYYLRALKSETASLFPALHFDLAWCCGKIKEYDAEKQAYKECLKLDPDYPYARNNLGWSLMKARKYEDAVLVFREAIKRGKDGNYPLRNLARALRRLGRYSEAIEALRQNVHRGAVTPRAQREIAELEALLRKQAAGGKLDDDVPTEEPGEGGEAGTARWPGKLGAISTRAQKRTAPGTGSKPISGREGPPSETPHHQKSNCIPTEETLEGLLEEMIRRDGQAFGRKLRMFESAEGLYGRQLPIPGIGRIDLLVEDIETRELIVVELKRERDTDAVVGQLLRYIGWVQKNLAQGNQKVRGIICLHGSSEKLRLAVSPLPDVEVYEYNLSLKKLYPSRVGESHPA